MEISPISYLFNTFNIFIAIMDALIDIHIYMYCIVATKLFSRNLWWIWWLTINQSKILS